MQSNTILQRTEKVQFARLDDEMLAIDSQAGYCYSLNQTAIQVWELLAQPISLSELCKQLQACYQIDTNTCTQDVVELVQVLQEAELVQVRDEATL